MAAPQCEWHAVTWLTEPGRFGVVRLDESGRWVTHRGLTDAPRLFVRAEAAQRAALGRPPFGVVPCALSFASVTR